MQLILVVAALVAAAAAAPQITWNQPTTSWTADTTGIKGWTADTAATNFRTNGARSLYMTQPSAIETTMNGAQSMYMIQPSTIDTMTNFRTNGARSMYMTQPSTMTNFRTNGARSMYMTKPSMTNFGFQSMYEPSAFDSMATSSRSAGSRALLLSQPAAFIKTKSMIHDPSVLLRKEKVWAVEPSARAMYKGAMTKEGAAEVVEQQMDMPEPGRYAYHFKTNNGIEMVEQAALDGESAKKQGSYMWTSPEGETFKVEYIADEMGFHPVGAHLPVAPEIPVEIQRSIEWNLAHPDEETRKWDSEEYVPGKVVMTKSIFA